MREQESAFVSVAKAYRESASYVLVASLGKTYAWLVDDISMLLWGVYEDSTLKDCLEGLPSPMESSAFVRVVARLSEGVSRGFPPVLDGSSAVQSVRHLSGRVPGKWSLPLGSVLLLLLSALSVIGPLWDRLPMRFLLIFSYVAVLSELAFFLCRLLSDMSARAFGRFRGANGLWT